MDGDFSLLCRSLKWTYPLRDINEPTGDPVKHSDCRKLNNAHFSYSFAEPRNSNLHLRVCSKHPTSNGTAFGVKTLKLYAR